MGQQKRVSKSKKPYKKKNKRPTQKSINRFWKKGFTKAESKKIDSFIKNTLSKHGAVRVRMNDKGIITGFNHPYFGDNVFLIYRKGGTLFYGYRNTKGVYKSRLLSAGSVNALLSHLKFYVNRIESMKKPDKNIYDRLERLKKKK